MQSRSTLIDLPQAIFELVAFSTNDLGADWSKCKWLPLLANEH